MSSFNIVVVLKLLMKCSKNPSVFASLNAPEKKLLLHPGKTHVNQQIYNIFYHAFHCVANFLVFNFVEYLADLVTEEINLVFRMKF